MLPEIDFVGSTLQRVIDFENVRYLRHYDNCFQLSVWVILSLHKSRPDWNYLLLQSFANSEEKFIRNPAWPYHSVFLVGAANDWLVGSGSRLDMQDMMLFGHCSLDCVLKKLVDFEGCTWPDSKSILENVKNGQSKIISDSSGLYSIPVLTYDDGFISFNRVKVELKPTLIFTSF